MILVGPNGQSPDPTSQGSVAFLSKFHQLALISTFSTFLILFFQILVSYLLYHKSITGLSVCLSKLSCPRCNFSLFNLKIKKGGLNLFTVQNNDEMIKKTMTNFHVWAIQYIDKILAKIFLFYITFMVLESSAVCPKLFHKFYTKNYVFFTVSFDFFFDSKHLF